MRKEVNVPTVLSNVAAILEQRPSAYEFHNVNVPVNAEWGTGCVLGWAGYVINTTTRTAVDNLMDVARVLGYTDDGGFYAALDRAFPDAEWHRSAPRAARALRCEVDAMTAAEVT